MAEVQRLRSRVEIALGMWRATMARVEHLCDGQGEKRRGFDLDEIH